MLINNYTLSDSRLYHFLSSYIINLLCGGKFSNLAEEMKDPAYACWHKRNTGLSDHIFLDRWEQIEKSTKKNSLSVILIKEFNEYYFDKDKRYIAIKLEQFGEWQNLLSHISCFPMLALKLLDIESIEIKNTKFNFNRYSFIKDKIGFRTIISPYHQLVEDYIYQSGLNESHIHLNGTTTMEHFWLDALKSPDTLLNDLIAEHKGKKHVHRLYILDPILNKPEDFYNLLIISNLIRDILNKIVSNNNINEETINRSIRDLISCLKDKNFAKLQLVSVTNKFPNKNSVWDHISEINFHINLIDYLKNNPKDNLVDSLYLFYIVCMNCFIHITAQPFYQKGFEQFQKFADNGVRETREKKYMARFYQLHGPNYSERADLKILEGRFSPKKTLEKNEELLKEILLGFTKYTRKYKNLEWEIYDINTLIDKTLSNNRPKLRLVAHFIKQKSKEEDTIHFETLRNSVDQNCNALLELFLKYPNMRKIVTGIDVAANELDATPEVFAPLYRKCRKNGIKHFTYHVGEDFKFLLSGIRAIYDAITLLELNSGDRLGHATAIGIDPYYWMKKVPDSLYISQGQLLEDLLFIRKFALEYDEYNIPLYRVENKIKELSFNIFNEKIDLIILDDFFNNRELDPFIIEQLKNNYPILNKSEFFLARERLQKSKEAIELLYKRWKNNNIVEKYEKKIIFEKDFFQPEILLKIQQSVQKLVSDRNIIIETLPTSNVRISLYDHIEEHHIFRWLQVEERKFVGDIPMQISLGSDDTGIFVTDLRNEFYHLFAVLITKFKYSPRKALRLLSDINENGEIYHFDVPTSKDWNRIFSDDL